MITNLVNATTPFKKRREPTSRARVTPTPAGEAASGQEESRNAAAEKRARGAVTKSGEGPSTNTTMARLNGIGPVDVPAPEVGDGGDGHASDGAPAPTMGGRDGEVSEEGGSSCQRRQQQDGGQEGQHDDCESGSNKTSASSSPSLPDKLGARSDGPIGGGGGDGGGRIIGGGAEGQLGGAGAGGFAPAHNEESPALASVDTAASTQPPPSPLHSPGLGALAAAAAGAGGGEIGFQYQQQQQPQSQYQFLSQQPRSSAWSSPWGTGAGAASVPTSLASSARPPLAPDEDGGGSLVGVGVGFGAGAPSQDAGGVWGASATATTSTPSPSRTPPRTPLHRRSQSWEDGRGGLPGRGGGDTDDSGRGGPGSSGRRMTRQQRPSPAGTTSAYAAPLTFAQQLQLQQQEHAQAQAQAQGQWVPSMQQQQQQQPSSPSVRSWSGQLQSRLPQLEEQQSYEHRPREFVPQQQSRSSGKGSQQQQEEQDNTSPLSSPSLSPRMVPILHAQQPSPLLPQQGQRAGKGVGRQQQQQQQQLNYQQQQYSPGLYQMQPQQSMQYQLQPRPAPQLGVGQQQQQIQQQQQHQQQQQYGHGTALNVPISPGGQVPRAHQWGAGGAALQRQQPPSAPGSPTSGHYHQQQQQQQHPQHHHPQQQQQHPHHPTHHHGGPRDRDQHQHQAGGGGGGPTSSPSGGTGHPSNRSAPEVLKTLLRKKACLYEPRTSHAVALVTWLVGRKLALSHGYFSRQQLQSGVHDVVSDKINAGVITRTKVNRCMQIILNSCFHYIIPRPDGSEEDGGAYRVTFARGAADDAALLGTLPAPWNDLVVTEDDVTDSGSTTAAAAADAATASPAAGEPGGAAEARYGGETGGRRHRRSSSSGGQDESGGQGGSAGQGSKRSVLLCFNENVRSAQDVFRCHNEFVRDAAHGANLLLTAEEWRSFYSGSDDHSSHYVGGAGPVGGGGGGDSTATTSSGGMSVSPASLSPGLRPADGGAAPIQPPVLVFEGTPTPQSPSSNITAGPDKAPALSLLPRAREDTKSTTTAAWTSTPELESAETTTGRGDVLGEMDGPDLARFRTTWCAKRYDHDATVCGFAHVYVNRGWLRRDPILHRYGVEMCPDVKPVNETDMSSSSSDPNLDGCTFNSCGKGIDCPYAHSMEEVEYHPDRYKTRPCQSRPCSLRDVCPNLHPPGAGAAAHHHHHHHHHHHQHAPRPTWHRRGEHGGGGRGGPPQGASSSGGGGRGHHGAGGSAGAASSSSSLPHPGGAPMMYVSPAPESEFDRSLLLPGLQNLFRRRSACLFAHRSSGGKDSSTKSIYNNFGDDWGLVGASSS